jgi:hypothetical protein
LQVRFEALGEPAHGEGFRIAPVSRKAEGPHYLVSHRYRRKHFAVVRRTAIGAATHRSSNCAIRRAPS